MLIITHLFTEQMLITYWGVNLQEGSCEGVSVIVKMSA